MAEVCGKDGSLVFSSGGYSVHNWTLNYVGPALETTDFDDSSGGRSFIPGITSWSGSYDCFYATGNTVVAGSTGTIYLMPTSSTTTSLFTGSVIITGMDVGTPIDGIVTQSYTFQGSGKLGTTA